MNIKNTFIIGMKSLAKNKMRTALTSIGVIIGVSSVIIMIGIGSSARVAVKDKVYNFGTNAIALQVQTQTNKFTTQDIKNIQKAFPQIQYITPLVFKKKNLAKHKGRNIQTMLYGVNNDYFKMKNWPLAGGRYFTEYEILAYQKVAIIGSTVARELFQNFNPEGRVILVNDVPFRVIGTLMEQGTAFSGRDFDNVVITPYTTAVMRVLGSMKEFHEIYVAPYSETLVDDTVKKLSNYYYRVNSITPDRYNSLKVVTSKEKLKMAEYISKTLAILLAGIASISLFVGGVGIMNIMLVSVSERTREIGIRMAIGAKGRDILMQFLIESVMLSSLGGITGILIGLGLYYIIAVIVEWPFIFSLASILVSFVFASSVGIMFGFYPARKAAQLNPIDALRHE